MSREKAPWRDNPWNLTQREVQVLVRLAEHDSTQIGALLSMSKFTVADHVNRVLGKMGLHRQQMACVLFDRWWQAWQRKNADELPAVWEELQL